MGFQEWVFGAPGEYDYGAMCIPTTPCTKSEDRKPLKFYSKDEPLPLFMAALMGLQHAFAMVGGLITPPLVVTRFSICGFPFCPDLEQYAISAALITSGICSLIQVSKIPIPFTEGIFGRQLYLGSGVLSVMGTSFTFLPIYEIAIAQIKNAASPDEDLVQVGREAYGALLGTSMICCLLELVLSVMPLKPLKTVFPPLVTSITVILIGVALTGTGMKYWGGGVVCAEMAWKDHAQLSSIPVGFGEGAINPNPSSTCANGQVSLGFGSSEYVGLGFSVVVGLIVIELFGSIFMKNCNVIIALLFGYAIAGFSNVDGNKYVDSSKIESADVITFIWKETFPLGFYGPALIPMLIAFLVTTVETVGDVTAVYEVSELDTESDEYPESIQGGLTSDAACSIISGLFTTMPNTTFSQNNGVIALTKCASRRAGYACGFWLIFMGIFSKIAGVITSIPDCVLGGMTIFLFANVLVSGISLAGSNLDLHSRRNKFILAVSLGIGVGVTVWPFGFQDMRASSYTAHFWECSDCSETMQGLRNGVSIFLSTGYCVGTVLAVILNLILPQDPGVEAQADNVDETKQLDQTKAGSAAGAEIEKPVDDKAEVDNWEDEVAA